MFKLGVQVSQCCLTHARQGNKQLPDLTNFLFNGVRLFAHHVNEVIVGRPYRESIGDRRRVLLFISVSLVHGTERPCALSHRFNQLLGKAWALRRLTRTFCLFRPGSRPNLASWAAWDRSSSRRRALWRGIRGSDTIEAIVRACRA